MDFSDLSHEANSSLAAIKEPLLEPRIIALRACKTSSARSGLSAIVGLSLISALRKDDSTKDSVFCRSRFMPSINFQPDKRD